MKIRLRISGGFAGIVQEAVHDSSKRPADLPAPVAQAARALMKGPAEQHVPAIQGARDVTMVELRLENGAEVRSISAPSNRLPKDVKLLATFLRPLARPVPPPNK